MAVLILNDHDVRALLDSGGAKVGRATDYAPVIEPRAKWEFRALLVPKNVASARVTGVQEKP